MGAYAALGSLMHTIEHVQHHPRPSISLDKNQVLFLTEKVTFLQEFLNGRNIDMESDGLESRIADIARVAQDIIESRFVDRILAGSATASRWGKKLHKHLQKAVSRILTGFKGDDVRAFHESLQKVLEGMDLIKKEVMVLMEIKETTTTPIQAHVLRDLAPRGPVRSSSKGHNVVVGFDDVLIEMLDKLTSEESTRQIIPVVGMGGIGKTTLAKTVYSNQLIRHHFDVFAWTTISQQYNMPEIFEQLLRQVDKVDEGDMLEMSENELKEKLHKSLMSRRYLIILDDIWDIEAWEEIQLFFPDCSNRSRVVVTTRLSNLASQLVNDSYCLKMKLLDEVESWNLFCEVVFGKDSCPLDYLEEIGKKIARGCRGLPLSICVVGGILSKSTDHEIEYWEHVATNVSLAVNSDDNEHCLKILHMSYSRLPTHLKPCLLYMGVFPEDEMIRVSKVIELWVSEGFLKPIGGKALEVVAKEYLNELIERNLISVHSLGSIGTIKYCNIHDLLRDFCLRQAKKERFVDVLELHNLNTTPRGRDTQRRYVWDDWRFVLEKEYHDPFRHMQLACSLYYYSLQHFGPPNSRLLRIWTKCRGSFFSRYGDSLQKMFFSKYYSVQPQEIANLSALTHTFWNLKTLDMYARMVPSDIWNMPNLRHVRVNNLELPDPPSGDNYSVLGNLQTLSRIKDFKCSKEIMKRIPNIKKLQIAYTLRRDNREEASIHFLHNIGRLSTLESLGISFLSRPIFWQKLTFPNSLKKLTLERFWADDVLEKIGTLPHLVKLKLIQGFFEKRKWATVEGQFRSLKYLLIKDCFQLEYWETESAHFPCLERLVLDFVRELEEIPLDIGEILTLASIHIKWCCSSVIDSAKKILKDQEEQGNESLQVRFQFEVNQE